MGDDVRFEGLVEDLTYCLNRTKKVSNTPVKHPVDQDLETCDSFYYVITNRQQSWFNYPVIRFDTTI